MYSKIGLLFLIIFFTIGCEKLKKYEEAKQGYEEAKQGYEEAKQGYEEATERAAKEKGEFIWYIKRILFTIACIFILRMVFRVLMRVLSVILLKKINFKPRHIVPDGGVRE